MIARFARFAMLLPSVLLANGMAWGCFCVGTPRKACEGFFDSDILFTGRVTRIEPRTDQEMTTRVLSMLSPAAGAKLRARKPLTNEEMLDALRKLLPAEAFRVLEAKSGVALELDFQGAFSTRTAHIQVLERFHGDVAHEVEIPFGTSSCDFKFQVEREYLIDASRDQKSSGLRTGSCSRTAEIKDPHQLDAYRNLLSLSAPPTVFGFVTRQPSDLELFYRASKPVAQATITIRSGEQTWQASTDAQGEYSLALPAPGSYQVEAGLSELPERQRVLRLDVLPGQCQRVNFSAIPMGSIRGKLLDADGHGVAGELVEIRGVPPTLDPRHISREYTHADGIFWIPRLISGEYRLLINPGLPPRKRRWMGDRSPYGETFYSGGTPKDQAVTIHLDPGQDLDNLEFRLPPAAPEWRMHGEVQAPDGDVEAVKVWLVEEGWPEDKAVIDGVRVGVDGQFTLVGAPGRSYAIFGHYRDANVHYHSAITPLIPGAQSPIRLALEAAPANEDCELCRKYQHLDISPDWK
ncbi:carboxypeptidase-like regulatory domain-containing protein [Paludibaculum fermentans]|uniref:carboxypeptidase-like regulatory domain-containing protein n=1 Tax=Paludibaculum fermentans TaxID=1473598 RepID=UPI003EBAD51D